MASPRVPRVNRNKARTDAAYDIVTGRVPRGAWVFIRLESHLINLCLFSGDCRSMDVF